MINIRPYQRLFAKRGWQLHARPFELNILGVRSKHTVANKFDDELHLFYKDDQHRWQLHVYPFTTDPGKYWLNNPIKPKGTAILAEGQYLGAYGLAIHAGREEALCQIHDKVTVIRDYNRNDVLDTTNGNFDTGWFGINLHPTWRTEPVVDIDASSAGCQVFQHRADFEEFRDLCYLHEARYGNRFNYTLVDYRALRRARWNMAAKAGIMLGLGIVGYGIHLLTNKENEHNHQHTKTTPRLASK